MKISNKTKTSIFQSNKIKNKKKTDKNKIKMKRFDEIC